VTALYAARNTNVELQTTHSALSIGPEKFFFMANNIAHEEHVILQDIGPFQALTAIFSTPHTL
jgi:hypothetical protein